MPIKFTPIKFPLKFRGVDVRNLEDLRKNFDLDAAIEYFRNGKLLQWLKVRFHDAEAEKISILDDTAPDFPQKLCAALGVAFSKKNSSPPVAEKKYIPRDEPDKNFRRAAEEKTYRPTAPTQSAASDELRDIAEVVFGTRKVWNIIGLHGEPTPAQKKMFIKLICGGEYSERDLIYLQADKDFDAGWALTRNAFCVGGAIKFRCLEMQADDAEFQAELDEKISAANLRGRKKIFYRDIASAEMSQENFAQPQRNDSFSFLGFGGVTNDSFVQTSSIGRMILGDRDEIFWNVTRDDISEIFSFSPTADKFTVLNDKIEAQIVKFLNFAKG